MRLLYYFSFLFLVVGEYDLSLGISYLLKARKRLHLPFISANLVNDAGTRFFMPSKMVQMGNVKVGFIGVIKKRIKKKKIPGGGALTVLSPVRIVKTESAKLRKKGAEIVIVLTDMSEMKSRILTKKELAVDVIISSSRRNRISLPTIQNKRIILHLNRYGENVGCLKIRRAPKVSKKKANMGGATASFRGFVFKNSVIPLGHKVKDEKTIAKLVNAFSKKYPYVR